MHVSSIRFAFNGILNHQLDSLFELIKQYNAQITVSRYDNPNFAFSRSDLILNGEFTFEFLQKFSNIFDVPLGITISIDDSTRVVSILHNYSALVWELDSTIFLGVSALSFKQLETILPFGDNMNFLKLLFFTPASSYLRDFLIVKPKGLVRLHKNYVDFLLPTHRADFLYLWLKKLYDDGIVEYDWLSNLTDNLKIGAIDETLIQNFDSWINIAENCDLGDFNMIYKKPLKILRGH